MYKFYCNNPSGNLQAGDCVIRAICKVTGETWEKIYTELSVEGYAVNDWGNANHVWGTYLRKNGFKRYVCPNDCPFCYSVNDFANEHTKGSYIVATGTHAVAVVDGDYYDSWDSGYAIPIYYYTKEEK